MDRDINTIAGQVTLMALSVLRSLTPYLLMYGARKNTKTPMNKDHMILKIATESIVLKRLFVSPLDVYMAESFEIAAMIPAVIRQINKLYIGIIIP